MRLGVGLAGAALLAAGCGGNGTATSTKAMDEHQGENAVCAECKVTGGGHIMLDEHSVQFAVNAIPESGPAAGPGFGGTGIAAKGKVQFQVVPSGGGGPDIRGDVDTIVTCGRTDGVLTATISGTLDGGRFTVMVTDGGEPEQDTIAFSTTVSFSTDVTEGNIQVHGLNRCEAPPQCPEGQCACEESHECEPCDAHVDPPPPPPPPDPPPPTFIPQ